MTDLYECLGVSRDADDKELKKAYREKAQQSHPDKGGDENEFKQHALAYEVLSNHDKRKYYDETGKTSKPDINQSAIQFLDEIITSTIIQPNIDPEVVDIIEVVRQQIFARHRKFENTKKQLKIVIKKFQKTLKRIKTKDSKTYVKNIIEKRLKDVTGELDTICLKIEMCKESRKILSEYEYNLEEF